MSSLARDLPRLTRALEHEVLSRSADGMGGFTESWSARGLIWADVAPGTGRVKGGEFHATAATPYRIRIRSLPVGNPARPKPGHRLRDGDRLFRVLAVSEDDSRGHYLSISAVEEEVA